MERPAASIDLIVTNVLAVCGGTEVVQTAESWVEDRKDVNQSTV